MADFFSNRRWVERGGTRWWLDPEQLIDETILNRGADAWECDSAAWVDRVVRPGAAVFDVGANIGYYAVRLARLVGPSGKVYAFEPMADPRTVLAHHVEANALANVEIRSEGLDAADGDRDATFGYSYDGSYRPVHARAPLVGGRVRFRTLDAMARDLLGPPRPGRLGFVKLDVDGYEDRVLAGATEVLTVDRPPLLVEACDYTMRAARGIAALPSPAHPEYGGFVRAMLGRLTAAGYDLRRVEFDGPTSPDALLAEFDLTSRSIDVLALPPGWAW